MGWSLRWVDGVPIFWEIWGAGHLCSSILEPCGRHCCNVGSKKLDALLSIFYICIYRIYHSIFFSKPFPQWYLHQVIYGSNLDFGDHVTQVACIHLGSSGCWCGTSILYPWQWRKRHSLVIKPFALRVGQQAEELFRIWTCECEKRHISFMIKYANN